MAKKLLMGNEAMAHAALEAGVRVVAGYPGTPSSEIVETVAKLHASGAAQGVHVEWSTNEKAALEVLFGASLAGARGLFTCKQMGLNVASDALMSLNYVSVRGGLVLVVADDPGPISSQTEQDTRRFAAFAKVPVLDPSTPEQAYEMVKAAFELSERFRTPVIVRPTTRVDHASAFFDVQERTQALPLPEGGFQRDASKWVIFPRRAYEAHGEINERLPQIAHAFASEPVFASFNEVKDLADDRPTLGILAGGISAAYAREALRMVRQRVEAAGIGMPSCRFMQVGTPYPFPEEAMGDFASGLTDVLVIEELDHVLEDALTLWVGRAHASLNVHGKLTGEARDRGENDIDDVASRIERFLGLSGRLRLARRGAHAAEDTTTVNPENLPVRPPVLCPGCPHRGAFYAVKQALDGVSAVMCGDIGCYTLGNAKPLEAVDTCLCMGAGITMAQGFSIVDPDKKAIAFVGDSTFFASGMTGLANAAYNGHDITVMVLDNATTAMTGSQPHPGTGVTLMGGRNMPLDIESVLVANGFARVFHADPLDKDASIVAVKAAVSFEGPSAVIFESPCIQLIEPDEPVIINPDACTGCKKCITEIGCPGIGFDLAREGRRSGDRGQAVIDPALCNGCGLCTQVCPFKAIEVPPLRGAVQPEKVLQIDAPPLAPAVPLTPPASEAAPASEEALSAQPTVAIDADELSELLEEPKADELETPDPEGGAAEATEEAAEDKPPASSRPSISIPSFGLSRAKMAEAAKAAEEKASAFAAKAAAALRVNSSVESAAARIAKVPVVQDLPEDADYEDSLDYPEADQSYEELEYEAEPAPEPTEFDDEALNAAETVAMNPIGAGDDLEVPEAETVAEAAEEALEPVEASEPPAEPVVDSAALTVAIDAIGEDIQGAALDADRDNGQPWNSWKSGNWEGSPEEGGCNA